MIRILDKHVADKIAAGEVVERPLSIVKELLENSVDAKAGSIVIEIKNGGKSYIRVTDDGCGIAAGEALLAFKRHATSKIYTDGDLEHIETLGFRGEALASVAAVSRCELITKTNSEKTGTLIHIEGSEAVKNEPVGCPDGTTIIVSDLFYNTPARHKFMKSDTAESSLIIDFVSKMAIAYADIKIRLINNGSILFSTQGRGGALHGIKTVYGGETGKNLVPVSKSGGLFTLEGFVSSRGYGKSNKKMQIFFVNGRNISSKTVEKGVAEAYADKMTGGKYPVCFLFLEAPPEKLDVNIHPNKKEIRFDDEGAVTEFVKNAINEALAGKDALPEIKTAAWPEHFYSKAGDAFAGVAETAAGAGERFDTYSDDNEGTVNACATSVVRAGLEEQERQEAQGKQGGQEKGIQETQVDIKNLLYIMREKENPAGNSTDGFIKEEAGAYDARRLDISELTVTGTVFFSTYITAVDETAVYFIDQHAAHERVFYERLLNQYRSTQKQQQLLMLPFIINVSRSVKNDAFDWLDALSEAGFEIEEFGPNAFLVKAIPAFMDMEEAREFIEEFLDNIDESTNFESAGVMEKIIRNSCKSAVKANDSLKAEEISRLLSDLSRCENPYNCPHGRPTFIKLSKDEIEKMFRRK